MDASTWSFQVPDHDHDVWILRAAYARSFPSSMKELGRSVGTSRRRAERAVRRLVEEGFLVERGHTYDFNDTHLLADEVGRWLYLTTGAERVDPVLPGRRRESLVREINSLPKPLPEHLRAPDLTSAANESPTHSALEARQAATAITEVYQRLSHLEHLAQEVYSTNKAERARDFIHLFISLNSYAELATRLLREHAARQDVRRQQSPWEPVVSLLEWERVGFLLDAQADDYRSAASYVARAYEVGRKAHRRREAIAEEVRDYPRHDSELQDRVLEGVIDHARQVEDLKNIALHQEKLYWQGGMPGFTEVGTLGDLLIEQALLRARDDLKKVQQQYAFPSAADSDAS